MARAEFENSLGHGSAAGDEASAVALAHYGLSLGERVRSQEGNPLVIHELVGIAIENITLRPYKTTPEVTLNGQSIQQRLGELNRRKLELNAMTEALSEVMAQASGMQITHYFERLKLNGEFVAMDWLRQNVQPSATP